MKKHCCPKHIRDIENKISSKLESVKNISSELLEKQQAHCDEILEVGKTICKYLLTYSIYVYYIETKYLQTKISDLPGSFYEFD